MSGKASNSTFNKLRFSQFVWSASRIGDTLYPRNEADQWGPVILIPLLATVILIITVVLLMVFRQNPTFVISTVAGCLIFISVYLILYALDSSKKVLA